MVRGTIAADPEGGGAMLRVFTVIIAAALVASCGFNRDKANKRSRIFIKPRPSARRTASTRWTSAARF